MHNNVELHNPDVVCVVESWLSTEIQNSEIHIPDYFIVRLDRNRHGGGVIMFIRNRFTAASLSTSSIDYSHFTL